MKDRQVSFAAGELAPTLWGREDRPEYVQGVRTLVNFIITQHGVPVNRPGLQKVYRYSYMDGAHDARIFPFLYQGTPLVCVLTRSGVSLLSFDETVLGGDGMALIDDAGLVYAESAVQELYISQEEDRVLLVHSSEFPYALTYDPMAAVGAQLSSGQARTNVPDPPVYTSLFDQAALFLYGDSTTKDEYDLNDPAGDVSHPARLWTWKVTYLVRTTQGYLVETLPFEITQQLTLTSAGSTVLADIPSKVAVYPDWTATLRLPAQDCAGTLYVGTWPYEETPADIEKMRIYRGRDGYFGMVAQISMEATGHTLFVDEGLTPDFATPPPQGRNPFAGGGDLPSVVAYFEGRRAYGGTDNNPSKMWMSAVDMPSNFDEVALPDAADPLEFRLRSLYWEKIRGLMPKEALLAFTSKGEWEVRGALDGGIIQPGAVAAHRIGSVGSAAYPQPVEAGEDVLFAGREGTAPSVLHYVRNAAQSFDASTLARHLFDGYTVKSWAFAARPWPVLWVLRNDGQLLSFSYSATDKVFAWATHEISGNVEIISLGVVPGTYVDHLFMATRLDGKGYIERLAPWPTDLDPKKAIFLDHSVSYDGKNTTDHTLTISGASADVDYDGDVTVTFAGTGTAGSVGMRVMLYDPTNTVEPVLLYLYANVSGDEWTAKVMSQKLPVAMITSYAADAWYRPKKLITGLEHLEGQVVSVVADGNVIEGKTVTAAEVVLGTTETDIYAGIIHAGLPYNSDIENLAIRQDRDRQKIVSSIIIELESSRGGYVGASLDDLEEIPVREVGDSYNAMLPKRIEVQVPVRDSWNNKGYAAYRNTAPMPATVLGITREYTLGD